jgi:hypothetical protein
MSSEANTPNDYARIVAKAWADSTFRSRLVADPAATLKSEGWERPDGMSVTIDDGASTCQVVLGLPPKPPGLYDDQLEAAANAAIPRKAAVACC